MDGSAKKGWNVRARACALEVAPDGTISADVRCARCAYDLIGVSLESVCPECGLPLHQSSGVFVAARGGVVASDIGCGSCGYSLRGLAMDGVCPECAAPTRPSVLGSRLESAEPAYVQHLAHGAMLVSMASVIVLFFVLAQLVFGVLAWLGFARGGVVLSGVTSLGTLIAFVVYAIGWWLLTARDPVRGKLMVADKARRATRVGLSILVGAVPLLILGSIGAGRFGWAPGWAMAGATVFFAAVLTLIGGLLHYVRSMTYLGLMSARMAKPRIRPYADAMAWVGPVALIVSSVIGVILANAGGGSVAVAMVVGNLAPATVLVLYWHLIESVRRGIREAREKQRDWKMKQEGRAFGVRDASPREVE